MLLSRSFGAALTSAFLLLIATSQAQRAALSLSADEIIQKAVEKASDLRPAGAQPGYTYTKVNITEQLDSKGQVKQRKQRVFQVCFRAGTRNLTT